MAGGAHQLRQPVLRQRVDRLQRERVRGAQVVERGGCTAPRRVLRQDRAQADLQRAIAAAPADEQARTGSSVHTIRTVGQSFGAAIAGLVAAASGMADDATRETLGLAMERVYATGAAYPAIALLVAIPLLVHGRRRVRAGE